MRRVAAARGISLTGSGAAFAALAYIVYRLTGGSAVWLSVTLLLTMGLQGVVQPFASWLGDRFDRRRVLVISDLAAAAGFVALAFAGTPGQLVVVAAITAVLESPVWAVAGASIPNLVEEEHLPWANGQVAIGTAPRELHRAAPRDAADRLARRARPHRWIDSSAPVPSCSGSTPRRSSRPPG